MSRVFQRSIAKISVLLGILMLMGACRTAPIYNVPKSSFKDIQTRALSMKQIEGAIIKACEAFRWRAKVTKPGLIVAHYQSRGLLAVIEIAYSTQDYSINYKQSENLREGGGMIHKTYNGWIQNLDQRIRTEISLL